MIESGKVVEVSGNTAKVLFHRTSACGNCKACGFKKGQQEMIVETENTLNAKVGDKVEMQITPGSIFKASAYAYMFPLGMLILGMIGGYIAGAATGIFKNPEIFSAVCGIVLTAVSFLVIKRTEPYLKTRVKNVFKMVAVIEMNAEEKHQCNEGEEEHE